MLLPLFSTDLIIVLQGMKFVVILNKLLKKRINQEQIDPEIQHWLQVMMQFVVIIEPNSVRLIKIFISEEESSLKKFSTISQQMV